MGDKTMGNAEPKSQIRPGRGGWALAAFFVVAPPAAAGGGMFLAPWLAFCGLVGAPIKATRSAIIGFGVVLASLLALAAWAAASVSWSTLPQPEQAAKIAAVFLLGMMFVGAAAAADVPSRRLVRACGFACAAVLGGLLAIEAFGDMPLNRAAQPGAETGSLMRNPGKGASVLIVLCWGAIGALLGGALWERRAWLGLFAVTAIVSTQFDMNANTIGFAFGAAGALLGHALPKFAPIFLGAGIVGWMILAPFLKPIFIAIARPLDLPLSWRMRLDIWDFALAKIAEKPVQGWGLDAARAFPETITIGTDFTFKAIPLHTHSASLHVWLETGAIGAVLAAIAILTIGIATARTLGAHRAACAAACGVMAATGAIWNISYGAWQEWWMAVPFAGAALAAAARR
jgi:O-antigen ligase